MSDLAAVTSASADRPSSNVLEVTVGELSGALKRTIEDRFGLVRVRGEISNYRGPHSSGHAYFSLKDDAARIDAVIWRTAFQRLKTKPQDGLEVIATGRVTTFPGKSAYQIVIEAIEPAGVGALMALLETRRKALAAEGLFDVDRKTPLPFLPRVIGVVTSPTGAVIRDILHRLGDRFPRHVVVWPVRVQGETAAEEVAAALAGFNAIDLDASIARPDVLIVARGGGSLEDLWAFNEEVVVRAVAASGIPVISAVGHETDMTLIDHAADLRAPTPSGAAEKAVPVRVDLLSLCGDLGRRHTAAIARSIELRRRDVRAVARALPAGESITAVPRQKLDRAEDRLASAVANAADRRHLDVARLAQRLARQAPRARLAGRQHALATFEQRLAFSIRHTHERRTSALGQGEQRLRSAHSAIRCDITRRGDHSVRVGKALSAAMASAIAARRGAISGLGKLLETLGYPQILARGFALVRSRRGMPLLSAREAANETSLDIEFADGHISAHAPVPRRARVLPKMDQGSLF